MRTKMYSNNSDELEVTLSMTMNLGEWKRLKEQLESKYPSWQLSSAITDMILRYEKVFSEEIDINV